MKEISISKQIFSLARVWRCADRPLVTGAASTRQQSRLNYYDMGVFEVECGQTSYASKAVDRQALEVPGTTVAVRQTQRVLRNGFKLVNYGTSVPETRAITNLADSYRRGATAVVQRDNPSR